MKQLNLTEEQYYNLKQVVLEGLVVQYMGWSIDAIECDLREGNQDREEAIEVVNSIVKELNDYFGIEHDYDEVVNELGWLDLLEDEQEFNVVEE